MWALRKRLLDLINIFLQSASVFLLLFGIEHYQCLENALTSIW
jgi:hypothetical protein